LKRCFTNSQPVQNGVLQAAQIHTLTELSREMNDNLKKSRMRFVKLTNITSFMQALGLLNDHLRSCFRYNEIIQKVQEDK
jgi:DNA-3-methyladenine glycosylase I